MVKKPTLTEQLAIANEEINNVKTTNFNLNKTINTLQEDMYNLRVVCDSYKERNNELLNDVDNALKAAAKAQERMHKIVSDNFKSTLAFSIISFVLGMSFATLLQRLMQ